MGSQVTMTWRTGNKSRAFTLIELVFVLVILGILLVASIPRFANTTERLRLEQTAFEFAQLLRYAHERAVSEEQTIVWRWDETTHRARLELVKDDGTTQPIGERLTMSARLPVDVSVNVARQGESVDEIHFFPDGTSEPTTVQVSNGHDSYNVQVDAATSHVALPTGTPPR